MKRLLTSAALTLAIGAGACGDSYSPASPTRTQPEAPAPEAPAPAPTAKLTGTVTVATSLTATGGYQYTAQVQLTESGGVPATITTIHLVRFEWGGYKVLAEFGPGAWGHSSVIAANGTLTSKPLVTSEEMPSEYYLQLDAWVSVSDAAAGSRTISIHADTPPMPQPPPTARFMLAGSVIHTFNSNPLSDAVVEVLNGQDAGRKATTGPDGTYTIAGLRTGELSVRFSKAGYGASDRAIDLKSNRTLVGALTPDN